MASSFWALGTVLLWFILSFRPIDSPLYWASMALVAVFVWSIFLLKDDGNILGDMSNDSDSSYYPSSPDDVFKVRRFLIAFLPPELVNNILDDAEYWPRIRSTIDRPFVVRASSSKNHDASLRCLVTPAFPSSDALGGPLRVKLVKFDLFSSDQGWGGNLQDVGTYNGSYTWFEAAILRPGIASDEPQGWRHLAVKWGGSRLPASRHLLEVTDPEANGRSRWLVQRNRCAMWEPLLHSIAWQTHGSESETTSDLEENGSSDGAAFIRLLAPEDRIGLFARAMFPGWVNYVRSVDIVVYYAV